MGLFLGGHHRLICMHVYKDLIRCKSVCDVHPGIDPYPLLAQLCNRSWPDFVTFTACKKSRFGLKRGKKAQCVSNRCKDLFERKKYYGVKCTLSCIRKCHAISLLPSEAVVTELSMFSKLSSITTTCHLIICVINTS